MVYFSTKFPQEYVCDSRPPQKKKINEKDSIPRINVEIGFALHPGPQ